MKSDWKKVSEYLKLALGFVDPMDSTQTAFYFMKLSELIDVVNEQSKIAENGNK